MTDEKKLGEWVTNSPDPDHFLYRPTLKGTETPEEATKRVRDFNSRYDIGPPKATHTHTPAQLLSSGFIGLYRKDA